jgi:hypothetical protein
MDNVLTPPSCPGSAAPARLTCARAFEILWDSAWEALILAFLVQLFGGIAFDIVSGLWAEMTPSLPPLLAHRPTAEAAPGSTFDFSVFHHHRYALLFGLFFIGKSAARLVRHSGKKEHRQAVVRAQRVFGRVSDEWLSLVVFNAFAAFIAVLLLQVTQQFSWTQLLWGWLADLCRPLLHALASLLPGGGGLALLGSLIEWYQANQFKFLFWLFYSAAICDDLGLPNYKTLARLLWRRLCQTRIKAKDATAPKG